MLIFRVTQKLADKIKAAIPQTLPRADEPLADWTANLFVADRCQYIIVANTATLYAVIIPGRDITTPVAFINAAVSAIMAQMERDGCGALVRKRLIPVATEVVFSKTGDRSVMASLNDLVRGAKANIEYNRDTPAQTSAKLVETPLGVLDYAYPVEALRKLSEPSPTPSLPVNVIPFLHKT